MLNTEECGLFISEEYPQLAASPDRLVYPDAVLEIKCPYACREEMITSANVSYLKAVNGALTLDRSHNYYYQVQGQLLCCKRKLCIFVAYTFKDIVTVDIERDEEFIREMVQNSWALTTVISSQPF